MAGVPAVPTAGNFWVRNGNLWKTVEEGWVRDGTWKQFLSTPQTPMNRDPVWSDSIPAVAVSVGGTFSFFWVNYVTDADGDTLTLSSASVGAASVATLTTSGDVVQVRGVAVGTTSMTLTVSDGAGGTATTSVNIGVYQPNQRPVVDSAINSYNTHTERPARTFDLSSNFSDPDGNALTYTAVSSNTSAATESVSGSTLTVTPVGIGSTTVTVTANDGSLTTSFSFTVSVYHPPPVVVSPIPDQSMLSNATTTIDVSGHFNQKTAPSIRFSVSGGDDEVVLASISGSSLQLSGVGAGTTSFTVTATTYGTGVLNTYSSVADTFSVTVTDPDPPPPALPTISISADSTGIQPGETTVIRWTSTGATSVTVVDTGDEDTVLSNALNGSLTTPALSSGSKTYRATATNSAGSDTASVTVHVLE